MGITENRVIDFQQRQAKPIAVSAVDSDIALIYGRSYGATSSIDIAISHDRLSFVPERTSLGIMAKNGDILKANELSDINLCSAGNWRGATYRRGNRLMVAASISEDENYLFEEISSVPGITKGSIVPDYRHEGNLIMLGSNKDIFVAISKTGQSWYKMHQPILTPRRDMFDNGSLEIVSTCRILQGIFVLYRSLSAKQSPVYGVALLSQADPGRVIWRSETALWSEPEGFHTYQLLGSVASSEDIWLYWYDGRDTRVLRLPQPFALLRDPIQTDVTLKRHHLNPILEPRDNNWESVGVFNPAVLQDDDGAVHILYRALNTEGISYLGYARLEQGYIVADRSSEPAYWPREDFEGVSSPATGWSDQNGSGGGWGGCEDPKLTLIDEIVYLTYVAHDGASEPRIALSSISMADFLAQNWSDWKPPKLISEPGIVNKSGVILPEKVNGKFVIFHRVFPNILIDYRDDLEFNDDDRWLKNQGEIPIRPESWDSRKLSVGATPIRIDEGWLVIYHAVDDRDPGKYKIGAMILDYEDPSKALYRTNHPILSPQVEYENDWKPGIAYPSGAAIHEGTLFVYYGGGDKYVCVATADFERFIEELKQHKDPTLTPDTVRLEA